jgi:acyl-CoA reductase-like NAD-dependent aldehyde dehydrogenase
MNPSTTDPIPSLTAQFQRTLAAHRAQVYPSAATRRDRLSRLEAALLSHADELVQAMQADFGYRSPTEAAVFDVTVPLGDIRQNRRHLNSWMKPRRVGMPWHLLPASGRVMPQPKGVVGVIAPWNFPVYLSLAPVAAAFAAGNRVMLKPSELTPRTSAVMARMAASAFDRDEWSVHTGGVALARAFADLPFGHLLFTGSTRVGREIAVAAARNLTPVTLELGGKSPAIVGEHANLRRAAERIAFGKCANAGQICVAPDYVLVPRSQLDAFVQEAERALLAYYPQGAASPDFSSIVCEQHHTRLQAMLDEAQARGAQLRQPVGGNAEPRKLAPTLVIDPPADCQLMKEEIFGPILPVVPYDSLAQAQAFVNRQPAPLALYIFSENTREQQACLRGTLSGGACVNETAFHVLADTLPFGGVGESGSGAYHGKAGFDTFSHLKSVLSQPRLNGAFLFNPPIGPLQHKVGLLLRRFI